MRKAISSLVAVAVIAGAAPVWSAEQNPRREIAGVHSSREVADAVSASIFNVVYVPVRLAVSATMGVLGGVVGWMNGGNDQTASSLWDNTDGQMYITPRMIRHQEQLRFGRAR